MAGAGNAKTKRPTCFVVPGRIELEDSQIFGDVRLPNRAAAALAALIPLLGCGEEAAAMAFDGLADRNADAANSAALRTIGFEERIHDALLRQLAEALPVPPDQKRMKDQARKFHLNLGRGGQSLHLVKIAALDSAVCLILSRLIRQNAPAASDPSVRRMLGRIRNDEAGHVRLSRSLALAAGPTLAQRDAAAGAREALANILMLGANAFEDLAVDPAMLFRDVRSLPDGLLTL